MLTILTNGVSFSLVAGALCFVKFSKGHTVSTIHGKTLNIGSTGAKTISLATASYSGGGTAGGFSVPSAVAGTVDFLFIYTGSTYVLPLGAYVTYSDGE